MLIYFLILFFMIGLLQKYYEKKKQNFIIITDKNFEKVDLKRLIHREYRRNIVEKKFDGIYERINSNLFFVINDFSSIEIEKLKIFLKNNEVKYCELNEALEKFIEIKKK